MTTFLYLQRFADGESAVMPFDVLLSILARHGKPGRGAHDTEITFANGLAAGATLIGGRTGGALCVGFERPRFDAPLRALVWECMRELGCVAFDDALEMVYAPLHGATSLSPAFISACANGVRRVDSVQQLWPDLLETRLPEVVPPGLSYANGLQLFDEGNVTSKEVTIDLAIRPEACNSATLRVLRNLTARVDAVMAANPGYQPFYRFVHDDSAQLFLASAQLGPLAHSATMDSPGPGLSTHRPGFASAREVHAGAQAEQARLVAFVHDKYQLALDGSGASITALSALLDKLHAWYVLERARQPAGSAFSSPTVASWALRAGYYLGCVLASQVGGQWGAVTRGERRLAVVRTHRGRICHPHLQVLDHIINGAHDSVARWYAQLAVSDASACARADDIASRIPNLCALLPASGDDALPLAAQLARGQLDYSVASLRHLDAWLALLRQQGAAIPAHERERVIDAAGAYLGEVVRCNTPDRGQWQWMNYDDMVRAYPAFARQRPRARGFMAFLDSVEHTTYPLATVSTLLADARAESLHDYARKLLPQAADDRAGPLEPGQIEEWAADATMALALDQVRNAIMKWRRYAKPEEYPAMCADNPGWMGNDSLAEIYRRQHLLLEKGMVVWASLVQANNALFAEGPHDMPALLAYSLERHFEARPQALHRIAQELVSYKGKEMPPALQHIGQFLASEQQRAQDLALPHMLTRRRVMVSSFLAIRKHIPDDVMKGAWFPLLTHPDTLCLMIAPHKFWPPELVNAWKSGAML
ncbi:hypothetical protein INH39_06195 [Massilia violaceinigra]|uniref:Uncharacterized protein n=1 Tax=Massilia violaceinigra TaxID=2045208 RepID=A0ABY4A9M7_9BURK|nr:hypothetical protein [Massilia violaceinigra]UOD31302.1 hypothetical protein INH39_06195 [Massilia violaceinigra]